MKNLEGVRVYMAGGLFNIGEQHRNLMLARELEKFGPTPILPQIRAKMYSKNGKFNLDAIADDCIEQAVTARFVLGNLDGPDADSGTSFELGAAHTSKHEPKPITIGYRTDFRTSGETQIGLNGMFRLCDSIVYLPSDVTSIFEAEAFYPMLAKKIAREMRKLLIRHEK